MDNPEPRLDSVGALQQPFENAVDPPEVPGEAGDSEATPMEKNLPPGTPGPAPNQLEEGAPDGSEEVPPRPVELVRKVEAVVLPD